MSDQTTISNPIIFLDFDGVLNNTAWDKKNVGIWDQNSVNALNRVLSSHNDIRIVVSSSWRIGRSLDHLRGILEGMGVYIMSPAFEDVVIDTTPILAEHRSVEIKTWLNEHPNVIHFAILDDMFTMCDLEEHFIRTNMNVSGFTTEHILPTLRLLVDNHRYEAKTESEVGLTEGEVG